MNMQQRGKSVMVDNKLKEWGCRNLGSTCTRLVLTQARLAEIATWSKDEVQEFLKKAPISVAAIQKVMRLPTKKAKDS